MAHPAASCEVLVVGGGIIGSSIAYHIARQGSSVLVVDRQEVAAEPAASWASVGGIRPEDADPPELPLAREALARWPILAEELDADLEYHQVGHLLLAENEEEVARLQTLVRTRRELGFADVRFVNRQDALRLVPDLGEQVIAASFNQTSGQANPRLATRAFARAAERHGATYWTHTDCLALEQTGDRVVGARTTRGHVRAEQIVLAAGAWSHTLATAIGLQLPLRVSVLQALLSTPAPPGLLQPVLSAAGRPFSAKQLTSGEFLLGGGWLGDPAPDLRSYALRSAHQEGNWATACELFPPIGEQQLARAWGGLIAHSEDDLPFIGSVFEPAGLALAVGSWYGFALAPAIGRALADHLAGLPTPELDGLSPNRISERGERR
jgi:sarcosine oxidase subunit beta